MLKSISILMATATVLTGIGLAATANPSSPGDMFWVRTTQKTPEQVVAAVKTYTEANKWLYLAEFKIKGGQVTAVKICYPAIAGDIFAAGPHVAAMMPCGNIAVYVDQGRTTISMLHPRFMSVLAPHERMERPSVRSLRCSRRCSKLSRIERQSTRQARKAWGKQLEPFVVSGSSKFASSSNDVSGARS